VYYGRITPLITAIPDSPDIADLINISCSPNPFSGQADIRYFVPVNAFVNITLFDVYGKKVKTLISELKAPGNYSVNLSGDLLLGGLYYCRLTVGETALTTRIIHL
jgi:serine protease AprX